MIPSDGAPNWALESDGGENSALFSLGKLWVGQNAQKGRTPGLIASMHRTTHAPATLSAPLGSGSLLLVLPLVNVQGCLPR